jgi:hypothetical protein
MAELVFARGVDIDAFAAWRLLARSKASSTANATNTD